MSLRFYYIASLLLMIGLPGESEGSIRRVPADYFRITDALNAAADGDTITVAAGTYSPSTSGESFPLVLSRPLHLLGAGWDVTRIDAEGTAGVIDVVQGPGGHVAGFTLTAGLAQDGGGVRILAGTPEIERCLLLSNTAGRYGSAIYVTGGALPHIHHNVIWQSRDLLLNDGNEPHGIDLRGAGGLVEHNLVGRGDSNGIFIQPGSAPIIRSNILFGNGIAGLRGRGICHFGDAATVVAYNLFFGNAVAAMVVPASPFVDVTAAQANQIDPMDGIFGNLDGDPLFVDEAAFDWNLAGASPGIDTGDPGDPLDPDGTRADIGPLYHDQSPSGSPDPDPVPGPFLAAAPNPFHSTTTFFLAPPRAGPVRLLIFDAAGRVVRHLYEGEVSPAPLAIRWDGCDDAGRAVRPGAYFVSIQGTWAQSRKIIRVSR